MNEYQEELLRKLKFKQELDRKNKVLKILKQYLLFDKKLQKSIDALNSEINKKVRIEKIKRLNKKLF